MRYWKTVFVRHGTTDWNEQRRYLGRTDVPLNERGRDQAVELARQLAGMQFDAICTSRLSRALQTADLIRQTLDLCCPIVPDDQLGEIDFARIEGLTYEEAVRLYPQELSHWYDHYETVPPPGGTESTEQVRQRMLCFMKRMNQARIDNVLVVSHGGPLRTWLSYWNRKPFWEVSVKHNEWHECVLNGRRLENEPC